MQEAFIDINNIPTKVICFGRWLTEKPTVEEGKVILLIPGNPGIVDFYIKFMQILHDQHKCPVWIVGHSGHQRPNKNIKALKKSFGLRQQIDQKIAFIQQFTAADTKLHIISHSIGSYMTLELLKEPTIEKRIQHAYFLFPTIEKMKETASGKPLAYCRPLIPILCFFAWIFSYLPKTPIMKLLEIYVSIAKIPVDFLDIVYPLITNPKTVHDIFFLAFQELEQVNERDSDTLHRNCERISFLYGANDGWCCEGFSESIKNDFENIRVKKEPFQHAFIFKDNEEVAQVISNWMEEIDFVKNVN